MSDRNPRDRKPPFRRPGGKPFDKGRPAGGHAAGRRPAWRDRDSGADDGPVILYGWHTVTLALQNPARHIRKLLLTENAAPASRSRRSEEHTSELQSRQYLGCRLLRGKKNRNFAA